MPRLLIAIDGPAASGKTTLARNLSRHYGIPFVPSGNLYRAVTAIALAAKIDPADASALAALLAADPLACSFEKNEFQVSARSASDENIGDDMDASTDLRTPEVNAAVALVSAHAVVRDYVTTRLRAVAQNRSCIVEGRDIGTVVFPETPFKVYLDVPLEIRQARRDVDGENDCVRSRDQSDSTRAIAPLKPAQDAIHVPAGSPSPEELAIAVIGFISARKTLSTNT
jgi:cytidylate kinase